MQLNYAALAQGANFDPAVELPGFDCAAYAQRAARDPRWIHLGPGNIFRIMIARFAQDIARDGGYWPITAVDVFGSAGRDQLQPFDLLTLGVEVPATGSPRQTIIGGIGHYLTTAAEEDRAELWRIAANPEVSLVTMTITEKAYQLPARYRTAAQGPVPAPFSETGQAPAMVEIAQMLLARYRRGGAPINLVSCDNFSHNGDKLAASVGAICAAWHSQGEVDAGFLEWVNDRSQVAFPISVIDKITPRPASAIAAYLAAAGWEGMEIDTSGPVPLAGFVNAEPTQYLVIEDAFAAPMPPLPDYGVHYASREVCDAFESMKVTTCLNPIHTFLALTGCLLGKESIDATLAAAPVAKLAHHLGAVEGLPVVDDPEIIDPAVFFDEVYRHRLTNPNLPDQPARIAMDTSQKLPIRFGITLGKYLERGLDLGQLRVIILTFALWLRYRCGVDDSGEVLELAPDPLPATHSTALALALGTDGETLAEAVRPVLTDSEIWGHDLYRIGMAEAVIADYQALMSSPGAVAHHLETVADQLPN